MPRQADDHSDLVADGQGASTSRADPDVSPVAVTSRSEATSDVGSTGERGQNAAESGQQEMSLGRRFLNVQTLASFGVAFVLLFFLITRVKIDFPGTLRAIAGADPAYYVLALVAYYLVFPVRALRWRRMLANAACSSEEVPRLPRLVQIIFLSWFANCLVPAKLGDVYRAYLLKRWAGISGSKAGGTIVAERLIDLATLLLLAGIAGFVGLQGQPREKLDALVGPLEMLSALIALAAVGLITIRYWSRWVRNVLPSRLQGLYGRFEEGALGSFGGYHVLLPCSLLAWLCEALRLFLVTRSLGLSMAPSLPSELAVVTAVALVGALLTAMPLTPAGLGFVESGLVASLLLFGVGGESLAFSVAFLDRTISYVSLVVFGIVAYLASARGGVSRGRGAAASLPDRA